MVIEQTYITLCDTLTIEREIEEEMKREMEIGDGRGREKVSVYVRWSLASSQVFIAVTDS